jgi:hypothetical protein
MAANDQGAAATPLLIVNLRDISERARKWIAGDLEWFDDYEADFSYEKTDIGATPAVAVNASRQVLGGDVHSFIGVNVTETTGAAGAQFRLLDGSAVGAMVIHSAQVAQKTTYSYFTSDHGIRVQTGRIFIQIISGSLEGVVYWR